MRRPASTMTALVAVLTTTIALSACGILGPARDADGRVTGTSIIGSTTLEVGDCFSFVDGSNLAEVTVTPCDEEHSYIVLGNGELSAAAVDDAGGLQNAVSAACAEDFETFKAAAAEGIKPEQEFIVSTQQRDGKEFTSYHCVATDAIVVSAD